MAIRYKNLFHEDPFGFQKFHPGFQADTFDEGLEAAGEKLEQKQEAALEKVEELHLDDETTKGLRALIKKNLTEKLQDNLDDTIARLSQIDELKSDDPKGYAEILKKFNQHLESDGGALTKAHDKEILDSWYEKKYEVIVTKANLDRKKAFAHIFLKKDGKRLTDFTSTPDTYDIDFGGLGTLADKKIGLGDIFHEIDTSVQRLTVTHNGVKTEGYRADNGKFYKLSPSGQETQNYLSVRHGDKVRVHAPAIAGVNAEEALEDILEDVPAGPPRSMDAVADMDPQERAVARASVPEDMLPFADSSLDHTSRDAAAAPSAAPVAPASAPAAPAAAAETTRSIPRTAAELEEIKAARNEAFYEAAYKHISEEYMGKYSAERRRERQTEIPEGLQGKTGIEYAEIFSQINHGADALEALSVLKDVAEVSTETRMWEMIRRRQGEREIISLQEIVRTTTGKSPEALVRRIDRGHEDSETYKAVLAAAEQLLQAIEKMSYEAAKTIEDAEEAAADQAAIESVCSLMFDLNDEGPIIKPSLADRILRRSREHTIDMQLHDGRRIKYKRIKRKDRVKGGPRKEAVVDFMQTRMSDESAWIYLAHSAIEFDPTTGQETVNKSKFVENLNELIKDGIVLASSEAEFADQVYTTDGGTRRVKTVEEVLGDSLTFDNMHALLTSNDLARDLIRLGMTQEMADDFTQQQLDEEAYLAESSSGAGLERVTDEILDLLADELTDEQLAQVASNVEQYYIGTVGLIMNQVEGGSVDLGAAFDANIPIPLIRTDKGEIVMHVGFKDNTITHNFELHAGVAGKLDLGRVDLGLSFGAQASAENIGLGGGASASIDLDKYRRYSLDLGVFAGGTVSGNSPLGVAAGLVISLGVSRDVSSVLAKKTDDIREERETDIEAAMDSYGATLEAAGIMDSDQVARFKGETNELMLQMMQEQAIDDLRGVQFLGAGVSTIIIPTVPPMILPVPYIKIGIKGKQYVSYAQPEDMPDLDDVARQRMQEAVASSAKVTTEKTLPVYVGSVSQFDRQGRATMAEANFHGDSTLKQIEEMEFEARTSGFEGQGIDLAKDGNRIRLDVFKTAGNISIYTDASSGIQTYIEDGQVYINLDKTDHLVIKRVDEYASFKQSGAVHNVELFITNDSSIDHTVIRDLSTEHIHYKDDRNGRTEARVIQDRTMEVESATYESEAELKSEGLSLGDVTSANPEFAERRAIREEMNTLLMSESKVTLSSDRKTEIRAIAKELLAKDKSNAERRLEYKQLSAGQNHEKVMAFLYKEVPDAQTWSNTERSFMIQALMEGSMAEMPNTQAEIKKHILGWNQTRLSKTLQDNNMPKGQADRISKTIMESFAAELDSQFESGRDFAGLPRADILEGAIVQIQVGSEKIEGYREAFWDHTEKRLLLGKSMEDTTFLEGYGLEEEDAQAFLDTMTERVSPLEYNKPYELMRSQLGLQVLQAADVIFTPKEGRQVIEMFKYANGNTEVLATSPEFQQFASLYNKFTEIVKGLRDAGKYENSDVIITSKVDKDFGFYDACRNFAVAMKESISIQWKVKIENQGEGGSVQVRNMLEGRTNVNIIGAGAAATYNREEKEELTGSKKNKDTQTEGQDDNPDEIRSNDDEGQGGSAAGAVSDV